jgi:DNA-binding protein H-NS
MIGSLFPETTCSSADSVGEMREIAFNFEFARAIRDPLSEIAMPKTSLASMSVEALFKLRDGVAAALSQKAEALKKELRSLGEDYAEVGRIAIYGRKRGSSLRGRKAPVKYRDRSGNTWAGRGAQPVWLREKLKAGVKLEDFAVHKSAASGKTSPKKSKRRRRGKR